MVACFVLVALGESPFNQPVEGVEEGVNVERRGVLVDNNDQGFIEGAGNGGRGRGNHGRTSPC